MSQLTVSNLHYGREQPLLSEIHFTLDKGEFLQVHGANGSGKSTLLRILAGFIQPDAGVLAWRNEPITLELYQQQLHYLGHQNGLKPYLTVMENCRLLCALLNVKITSAELNLILQRLRLEHAKESRAETLSAGQARRLALARLLLKPAALWILDEPTTGLDQEAQELLVTLLHTHIKNHGMAIVATHQAFSLPGKIIRLGSTYA